MLKATGSSIVPARPVRRASFGRDVADPVLPDLIGDRFDPNSSFSSDH